MNQVMYLKYPLNTSKLKPMIKLIDLIESNIAPKIEKFIIKHEPIEDRYYLFMPNDVTDGNEIGEIWRDEIRQEHPYLSVNTDIDYESIKKATKGMAGVKIEKNNHYYSFKVTIPRKYFEIIEDDY